MNLKKAIISGILLYALIFLTASALLFAVSDSTIFGTITLVVAVVLTFLISKYYYFKGVPVTNPMKDGLMLGLTMAAISFAIEVPVMVYGFAAQRGWSYFMSWHILLGYLLVMAVPILTAYKTK